MEMFFSGAWVKDKRNGFGKIEFATGDKYEGMWVDDYRGMKGIYTWKNGNVYDGEWKTDERNGKGVQKNLPMESPILVIGI